MALSLQSFAQWTSQQVAAVQGSAAALVDTAVGTVVRAILEANASVALWMQWLILGVLSLTRAATSNGSDLDSWMADFGLVRLPAVAATGTVTFARFTSTLAVTVPSGTTVQTADGTQTFATTAAVTIAAGTLSAPVAVLAQNAGTQGNVLAGTISVLTSAVPGIDTVTNAAGFTNGVNAESDIALRTRFALYINTRAEGTVGAVGYAATSVQQGISYTNAETPGVFPSFTLTINDGSGSPPSALLTSIQAAVNATRACGVSFAVQAPTVVSATVAATITVGAGYVKASLTGPAAQAVTAFIDALPLGAPLPYSRIAQVIYGTSPGITNVSGVTLNGGTADLGGGAAQAVVASSVSVT